MSLLPGRGRRPGFEAAAGWLNSEPLPFRVLLDGAPPGVDHGLDDDDEGRGTLAEPRLYQLIRQQRSIADRTFEIEFLEPGVEAYVFTFG